MDNTQRAYITAVNVIVSHVLVKKLQVFPKGSPLVADISRTIIKLTEDGKVLDIEKPGLNATECSASDGAISSASVPLRSFQGLFAVSGGITTACLLVSLIIYLHGNRDFFWNTSNSNAPIWSKICAVFRHYDQRDHSSFSFGKEKDRHHPHLELSLHIPVASVSYTEMENTAVVTELNSRVASVSSADTTVVTESNSGVEAEINLAT